MAKLGGWQKAGLVTGVGCFSIAGVLVIGLLVAVAWARSTLNELGDGTPVRTERTVVLPVDQTAAIPVDPAGAARRAPLRLTVELQEGAFTIRPGAPTGGLQVEGTWAPGFYELTESVQEAAGGDPRHATIRFASKAPAWARVLGGIFDGTPARGPEVTVVIPRETPLDLVLRVGMGESRIDLGGLTLGALELDLSMGEHRVDFAEPLVGDLRRLDLSASMGNVDVKNVGNTRAQVVEASGSMGNLTADLGGAWAAAAATELSFDQSMGELTIRVPASVRLETAFETSMGNAQNRGAGVPQTADANAARLRLHVSTSMGETRVIRY